MSLSAAEAATTTIAWTQVALYSASAILIVTHFLSFTNFFVDVRPSLLLALGMLVLTGVLATRFLRELSTQAGTLIGLFTAWQLATALGHIIPGGYLGFWSSPALLANAASYIIIPQFVCFLLGSALGRDARASERFLETMLWSNAFAVAVGIVLYLLRPGFVLAAEARVFRDIAEGYLGFLPRMNGYFNSMIMGAICYVSLGLLAGRKYGRPGAIAFVGIFGVGALLTMQRAAWVLAAGTLVLWGLWAFGRSLLIRDGQTRPIQAIVVATLSVAIIVAAWQFAQDQIWFDIAKQELENRIFLFDTIVSERRGQWDVAIALVQSHPFGVGVGLVSHKAAEVAGLAPYVVTDGNYFRILVETGVPGFVLFLALVGRALVRVAKVARWDIGVPLILLLGGAVGTNVFDLYYIGFVCWFLLGMASTATPLSRPALSQV